MNQLRTVMEVVAKHLAVSVFRNIGIRHVDPGSNLQVLSFPDIKFPAGVANQHINNISAVAIKQTIVHPSELKVLAKPKR